MKRASEFPPTPSAETVDAPQLTSTEQELGLAREFFVPPADAKHIEEIYAANPWGYDGTTEEGYHQIIDAMRQQYSKISQRFDQLQSEGHLPDGITTLPKYSSMITQQILAERAARDQESAPASEPEQPEKPQESAEETPPTPVDDSAKFDPAIQARAMAAAEGGYDGPIMPESAPASEAAAESALDSILGGRTPHEAYQRLAREIASRQEESEYLEQEIESRHTIPSLDATVNLSRPKNPAEKYQKALAANNQKLQALQEKLEILQSSYPDCAKAPEPEPTAAPDPTPESTHDSEPKSVNPEVESAAQGTREKLAQIKSEQQDVQDRYTRMMEQLRQEMQSQQDAEPARTDRPKPKHLRTEGANPNPAEATPAPESSEPPEDNDGPSLVDIAREAKAAADAIPALSEEDIDDMPWEDVVEHVERAAETAKRDSDRVTRQLGHQESAKIVADIASTYAQGPSSPEPTAQAPVVGEDGEPLGGVIGSPNGPKFRFQDQDDAYAALSDEQKAEFRAANTEYVQEHGTQIELLLAQGKPEAASQLLSSMLNHFKHQPYRKSGYPFAMDHYSYDFCNMLGQQIECYNDYPEYQFDFNPGDPARKQLPVGDHQEFMQLAIEYQDARLKSMTPAQRRQRDQYREQRHLEFYNQNGHYPSPASQGDHNDYYIEYARIYWSEHQFPGEFPGGATGNEELPAAA